MIPQLDGNGVLPPGVYDTTLDEIRLRYATTAHRLNLWNAFMAFLDQKHRPAGAAPILWIDGSYTTDKPNPSDIDVVADLSGTIRPVAAATFSLWLEHDEIKRLYSVDFWMRHPTMPNDLAGFFQYVGEKKAVQLGISPKTAKGILRVTI